MPMNFKIGQTCSFTRESAVYFSARFILNFAKRGFL